MAPNFQNRIRCLREWMEHAGLDAILVSHAPNILYLCGFSGSSGALVVGREWAVLITDGRYDLQARAEVKTARVRIYRGDPLDAVGKVVEGRRLRTMGFEAHHLTVAQRRALGRAVRNSVRWKQVPGAVEALRAVKDSFEIAELRASAKLASRVMEQVVPLLRPGIRELEVAAEIDFRIRKLGASGPSFETIIASGPRSALPHARPSGKKIRKNELVVLDLGAILRHYCSDLTRTVYLGKAPPRVRKMYNAVQEAQAAAFASIRPGIPGADVNQAARHVLDLHGLGRFFVHSLGHGVGLEIHEEPRLQSGAKTRLRAGHVVTVEPGVYIPGFGGIRIEDDVLVTPRGAEILTRPRGDFLEL
jgi:Xaa-Pro aminopeptidase